MSSTNPCLKPLCSGLTAHNWCDECMKDGDKSQNASYPFKEGPVPAEEDPVGEEEEEESEEEEGQDCRGCGCWLPDGQECVFPESWLAFCQECYEERREEEEEEEESD